MWTVVINTFFWSSFSVILNLAFVVICDEILVFWVDKSQSWISVSSDLYFSLALLLLDLWYQLFNHHSTRIHISDSCGPNKVIFIEVFIAAIDFKPVVVWFFKLFLLSNGLCLFSQKFGHLCLKLTYLLVKPSAKHEMGSKNINVLVWLRPKFSHYCLSITVYQSHWDVDWALCMNRPIVINVAKFLAFIQFKSYSISSTIMIRPLSKNVSINWVKPALVLLNLSYYFICLELEPLDSLFFSSQFERNLSKWTIWTLLFFGH